MKTNPNDPLRIRRFDPGEKLGVEGDAVPWTYVVRDGSVTITTGGLHIAEVGVGALIGDIDLMRGGRWLVSATAGSGGAEVRIIRRNDLEKVLEATPPFVRRWLDLNIDRLVDARQRFLAERMLIAQKMHDVVDAGLADDAIFADLHQTNASDD